MSLVQLAKKDGEISPVVGEVGQRKWQMARETNSEVGRSRVVEWAKKRELRRRWRGVMWKCREVKGVELAHHPFRGKSISP